MAREQRIEILAEMVANVLVVEVAVGDSVDIGDTVVLLSVLAFTLGFLLRRRLLAQLAFVCAAVAASSALRLTVHALVARHRPDGMLSWAAGWSYPSGHTSHFATAALLLLVLVWPRLGTRRQRIVLVAVVVGWAVLVGVGGYIYFWKAEEQYGRG